MDPVAKVSIDKFHSLCLKVQGFTVLAGIVANIEGSGSYLLTLACGTKCFPNKENPFLISDSHAEVIARRSLVRYLMKATLISLLYPDICEEMMFPLMPVLGNKNTLFKLKPTWHLHIFISENPCGDASIYQTGKNVVAFTGAKVISEVSPNSLLDDCNSYWIREQHQTKGVLRTKSGRSDIKASHRTQSHCCSDKICRWCILGLQGALLSHVLEPVSLEGIVVGRDARLPDSSLYEQSEALTRAITDRVASVPPAVLPHIVLTDVPFPFQRPHHGLAADIATEHLRPMSPSIAAVSGDSAGVPEGGQGAGRDNCRKRQRLELAGGRGMSADGEREALTSNSSGNGLLSRPWGCAFNWIVDLPVPAPLQHAPLATGSTQGAPLDWRRHLWLAMESDEGAVHRVRISCGGSVENTQALTGALLGATLKSKKRKPSSKTPPATVEEGADTGTGTARDGSGPYSRLSRMALGRLFARVVQAAVRGGHGNIFHDVLGDTVPPYLPDLPTTPSRERICEGVGDGCVEEKQGQSHRPAEADALERRLLDKSYRAWKAAAGAYKASRQNFLSSPLFQGWLCGELGGGDSQSQWFPLAP